MTITFFGVLWLLLLLILFLRQDLKVIILVLLLSMVLQCDNVVIVDGKGVGPQIITSLYFCIVSIFMCSNKRLVKKTKVSLPFLFVLSFFCFYVFLSVLKFNSLKEQFQDVMMLFIYLSTSICLYLVRRNISDRDLCIIMGVLFKFLLIMGALQFLVTSKLLPKWLLTELFFNDTSENIYYHAKYPYYRVMSTFMEPSYFSGIFCGLLIGMIYNMKKIKYAVIYIILGFIEIVLTISTTGYLTLLFGLLFLFLLDHSHGKLTKYMPYAILLSLFVIISWNTLLSEVVFNKLESNSGVARQSWNLKAFEEFLSSPLMGCGYIKVRASSLLLTILANLGLIGMFIYLSAFFVGLLPVILRENKNNRMVVTTRISLFCVVISQFVACPDLTLCTYWLCVYMVVLTGKDNKSYLLLSRTLYKFVRIKYKGYMVK